MVPESLIQSAARFKERIDASFFAGKESKINYSWLSLGWCSQFLRCYLNQFRERDSRELRQELSAYCCGVIFEAFRAVYPEFSISISTLAPIGLKLEKGEKLLLDIPLEQLIDQLIYERWNRNTSFFSAAPAGKYPLQALFLDLILGRIKGVAGEWANSSDDQIKRRQAEALAFLASELSLYCNVPEEEAKSKNTFWLDVTQTVISSTRSEPGEQQLASYLCHTPLDSSLITLLEALLEVPCDPIQSALVSFLNSEEKRPVSIRSRMRTQTSPLRLSQNRILFQRCREARGLRDLSSIDGILWEFGLERELGLYPSLILPQKAFLNAQFLPFLESLKAERLDLSLNELKNIVSDNPWIALQRAFIYESLGQDTEAFKEIKVIEAQIGGAPLDAQARFFELLGRLYAKQKDWESSGRMMELALKNIQTEESVEAAIGLIEALNRTRKFSLGFQSGVALIQKYSFSIEFVLQCIAAALGSKNEIMGWQWLKQLEQVCSTDERVLMMRLALFESGIKEVAETIN